MHSQQEHLYALLRMAREAAGCERVFVHAFMDGRDTLPTSGAGYLAELEQKMREYGVGKMATRQRPLLRDGSRPALGARAQGIRRDGERQGRGRSVCGSGRAREGELQQRRDGRVHRAVRCGGCERASRLAQIRDEDVCINFNYRADRARQITRVLARESGLNKDGGRELPKARKIWTRRFRAARVPKDLHYVCMTQYDKQFTLPMVILPESMDNLLANMLAQRKLRNLRVAETEKYAHVTYFFNGGIEKPFPGEDRALVPSQKVATYDLAPEMTAEGIARRGDQGGGRHGVRPDRGELRERRHGGALGQAGADDQGRGDGGCAAGPDLQGGARSGTEAG